MPNIIHTRAIKHGSRLRNGRISIPGQGYYLTFVCKKRRKIFADFAYARNIISVLMAVEANGWATTLGFVVMPDHVHWLMQLGEIKELAPLVQLVKSWGSKRVGRPIWQRGFYDHAIRQDEDMKNIARYIVLNPLRAGIVDSIWDYPHWDAMWL